MRTGHAVWPECRLAIPTLYHTCTKEDFMLVIGQMTILPLVDEMVYISNQSFSKRGFIFLTQIPPQGAIF